MKSFGSIPTLQLFSSALLYSTIIIFLISPPCILAYDFGSCPNPGILYVSDSSSPSSGFYPADSTNFPFPFTPDIASLESFICQRLQSDCHAPGDAIQGSWNAFGSYSGLAGQHAADQWNEALGVAAWVSTTMTVTTTTVTTIETVSATAVTSAAGSETPLSSAPAQPTTSPTTVVLTQTSTDTVTQTDTTTNIILPPSYSAIPPTMTSTITFETLATTTSPAQLTSTVTTLSQPTTQPSSDTLSTSTETSTDMTMTTMTTSTYTTMTDTTSTPAPTDNGSPFGFPNHASSLRVAEHGNWWKAIGSGAFAWLLLFL